MWTIVPIGPSLLVVPPPAGPDGASPSRRPRRYDPERRDRLVDVTLDVVADVGTVAATHRAIARAADVPLGSVTYHFASREDLLLAAFSRHAHTVADRFSATLTADADGSVLEPLVRWLTDDLVGSARDLVLMVELYVAAARSPGLRAVTQSWMQRSREVLERFVDPVTARELDAFVEGLVLHSALSTAPMNESQIRHALQRFVA